MRLTIVRHGEVMEEVDPNLTELGKRQVTELAKKLKKEKIDKIYSSDLKRTIETAEIIGKERKQNIEFTKILREVQDEIIEIPKKDWESKKDNEKRINEIKNFLKKLEKKHKNENILIVGHAKMNRIILNILTNISLYNLFSIKQLHTCVNLLELEDIKRRMRKGIKMWRILKLNSVEHLPKDMVTGLNKRGNHSDKIIL
jgi:broad specificity phosphatase PhoE